MKIKHAYAKLLFRLFIILAIPFAGHAQKTKTANQPVYGKYGCTASRFSGGQIEYTPKGSFVIKANGTYTYYGFKEPSNGKFTVDKDGNLLFTGGYFNGGKAEKIDRPNKFFLTAPGISEHRWTCGLVN
ncbi:MAG: hypothetical protein EOO10_11985 [Chitinophagaceae bacterium]|nr:MAG: hypothetical protein EOO10_11985 [Chitinophagaceae bacterium]